MTKSGRKSVSSAIFSRYVLRILLLRLLIFDGVVTARVLHVQEPDHLWQRLADP